MWPKLVHWSPGLHWLDVLQGPEYTTAFHYTVLNLQLLGVALFLGAGLVSCLLRRHGPGTCQPPVAAGAVVSLAIAAGFSMMVLILYVLGMGHGLKASIVMAVFGAGSALGMVAMAWHRAFWQKVFCAAGWRATLASTLMLALLLVYQTASVDAPSIGDATAYHMPMAANMVRAHGVVVDESLIYPWQSLNINVLYSVALMQDGDITRAQNLHALFATLTMFGIYQFSRMLRQPLALAFLLPFVFGEIFVVRVSRVSANVDLGATFFAFYCVFALWLWGRRRESVWLVVSAICLGGAMGSKYLMALFAFPVAAYIACIAGRGFWKLLAVYAGWAAVFGLGWYLRNWIDTGNPVHPFAPGIFGYYLWDERDIHNQMVAVGNQWIPHSVSGFLFAPYWAWLAEPLRVQGAFFILCLLYAATALLGWARSAAHMLLLFSWFYTVTWFFGSQDPRHLMAVFAFVLLAASDVARDLLAQGRQWLGRSSVGDLCRGYAGPVAGGLALVAVVAWEYVLVRNDFVTVLYRNYLPGPERDAMMRHNPVFDLMYEANRVFRPGEPVYGFFLREGRWFYSGELHGTHFGREGYFRVLDQAFAGEGETRHVELARLEHVLRRDYGASGFVTTLPLMDWGDHLITAEQFSAQFDEVYRNSFGAIYRFRDVPAPATGK